jgi:hypothetical protein
MCCESRRALGRGVCAVNLEGGSSCRTKSVCCESRRALGRRVCAVNLEDGWVGLWDEGCVL